MQPGKQTKVLCRMRGLSALHIHLSDCIKIWLRDALLKIAGLTSISCSKTLQLGTACNPHFEKRFTLIW